ncbi:uncharacterized protein LOC134537601 [Bacillus rossius redtenbacheri]|uniref:uncharacterized protein LOC134537601 n=1 Tax=Bacillus rossius redtenbacheri TaxID=93214 RepID=UPI002FDDAA0B
MRACAGLANYRRCFGTMTGLSSSSTTMAALPLLLLCWASLAGAISRKIITPADTFPVEATHFSQVSFPHRTGPSLSPLQQAHILDDVRQHRFRHAALPPPQEPLLFARPQFFGNPAGSFQVELQKSITDSDQIKVQLEQERLRELKALEEARLAQEELIRAYQQTTTTESQRQTLPGSDKTFGDKTEPTPRGQASSTEETARSAKNITSTALGSLRGHQPRAMTRFRFVEERNQIPIINHVRSTTRASPVEGRVQRPLSIGDSDDQDYRSNDFKSPSERERQKQLQDLLRNQFRGQLIQRQELLKRLKQVVSEPITQPDNQQTPEPVVRSTNSSFPLILADGQNLQFLQTPGGNIPFQLPSGGNFDIKTIVLPATESTPTQSTKQPRILFEDLTKGVLPPGAEFEVIRQKQDGGLEEVGKIPQDLPEKKVTFVFLEEQPDGTVKVQGVRGNSDGDTGDSKPPTIDVDSILKKLQEEKFKSSSSTNFPSRLQEIKSASTNSPGSSPEESINSPSLVAQASSNSLAPSTPIVKNYHTTPNPQSISPSVSYFATTNNILPPDNPQNHQSTHTPVIGSPQPLPTANNQQGSIVPYFVSNPPVYNQGPVGNFNNPPVNPVYNPNPPAQSQQQVVQPQQGSPGVPQQPLFNGHNQFVPNPAPIPQIANTQYTTALFPINHQPAAANHFLPTVPSQVSSAQQSFPQSPNSIAPTSPEALGSPGEQQEHLASHSSHKDVDGGPRGAGKKRQKNRFRATHATTTPLPDLEEDDIQVQPKQSSAASLTQIMKEEGLFAMARFLRESGLDDILNDTGPYTIFAPTDKAFRSLLVQLGGPEKADEKFKENPRLLSGLLLHHVIPGSFPLDSLQDEMTGVSLAGTQLRVNTYTSQDVEWNNVKVVAINGARVSRDKHDIEVPQGVAHAVDRVMFPLPVGSLLQTLQTDREHRFAKFLRVVQAADLASLLAGSKVHTLFAPTDRAFSAVSPADLERIAADRELSQALVYRHLAPGSLYTAGMRFFQVRDSLERGHAVTISKSGGQVKVNNSKVLTHNIPATNGVIHVIDGLL